MNTNHLDENLILESIRIVHTISGKQYDLKTAINKELAIPEDKIRDVKNGSTLSVKEAIEQSIIRFWLAKDQVEYIYRENLYIFGDTLYLFKYVLDPEDQKKLSLTEAFAKQILDDENHFYFGKKGPYQLETAIQKGFINCELIDLNLINNIVVSSVFKYSMYSEQEMWTNKNSPTSSYPQEVKLSRDNDSADFDKVISESNNRAINEAENNKKSESQENTVETVDVSLIK